MTTLIRGRSSPLSVEWFEFGGGPPAVVNSVIITITPLAGGIAVVGPTSSGVTNPATGINVYNWAVPAGLPVGDYLVVWDGEDTGTNPVQASEIISVVATVAGSSAGPCSTWDPIWCCDLLDSPDVTGNALQAATEVLWSLSGRQFDSCTVELWPCRKDCYGDDWWGGWNQWTGGTWTYPQPALIRGTWFNLTCGSCAGECSCTMISEVKLPGPIISILEVRMDDVVLTPGTDYRLDNGNLLVRIGDVWPWCNDMSQLAGDGTWSVTVEMGREVPVMGRMAVGEMACEFAKACAGDDTCRLPKTVQQLSRQGVSLTFIDPNQLFENGLTGLYFSDLFINATNPNHRQQNAKVYNIDSPDPRRLGSA